LRRRCARPEGAVARRRVASGQERFMREIDASLAVDLHDLDLELVADLTTSSTLSTRVVASWLM